MTNHRDAADIVTDLVEQRRRLASAEQLLDLSPTAYQKSPATEQRGNIDGTRRAIEQLRDELIGLGLPEVAMVQALMARHHIATMGEATMAWLGDETWCIYPFSRSGQVHGITVTCDSQQVALDPALALLWAVRDATTTKSPFSSFPTWWQQRQIGRRSTAADLTRYMVARWLRTEQNRLVQIARLWLGEAALADLAALAWVLERDR